MFQQGTKTLYVYLPADNPQMVSFADLYAGSFDQQYSRWKFSNAYKEKILSELEVPPLDSESDPVPSDTEDPTASPARLDKRLHRAQSFSRYESDSESESDNEDFKLNLDHNARKKLSSAQFTSKRHKISQCIQNYKHESATKKICEDSQKVCYVKPSNSPSRVP